MAQREIDHEQMLIDDIAKFYDDPMGFVMYAFPWDIDPSIQMVELEEPWASKYNSEFGPDKWACEWLDDLGAEIKDRGFDGKNAVDPIQMATVSGHGIGKSTLTAWLILFIMTTRPFAKGVVTANTGEQLKTKTWSELGKWWKKCITQEWFTYNNGKGNMNLYSVSSPESWRCDAQTCREENSESFAGLHAANSTPFYIFDEASAVPNKIWEVSEGGLTDGEPMRFVWGNPTKNTGSFFECFNRFRHRWKSIVIDSRNVNITNKKKLNQWVEDYGEDSDFVRVRVRGVFPRAGSMQFISSEDVDRCAEMDTPDVIMTQPVIMGVDVARFGSDKSVILIRRGRNARDIHMSSYSGIDTMTLAAKVHELAIEFDCDAIFVDGGGVGGGVVDRLNQLSAKNVIEVQFGGRAVNPAVYVNWRAEMWGTMKAAIKDGVAIPNQVEIKTDLTGIEYGYQKENLIQLEKKEDMKKRGLSSPDFGDALALTYALPVAPRVGVTSIHHPDVSQVQGGDYDPYA
ncbi:hypothetical protein [uncultured Paraglaciecola sp.]|uniref:hypothetical protein n=1 Tax=uncultured Paraglaciecola sp. TaxID=1765024 RepID=UPI00262E3912|nr:hypothetical protein [uncultured Paraglaciecola sp.]